MGTYQQNKLYKMGTNIVIRNQNGSVLGMKLLTYLHLHNLTIVEFAYRAQIKSRTSVYRYLTGQRKPTASVMMRIIEATQGQVGPEDFTEIEGDQEKLRTDIKNLKRSRASMEDHFGVRCLVAKEWDKAAVDKYLKSQKSNDNFSYPIWYALQILSERASQLQNDQFMLDGNKCGAAKIVEAANVMLSTQGKTKIAYPGVNTINRGESISMKLQ